VAQAVECLLSKCETLSSDPRTTEKKKNKEKTTNNIVCFYHVQCDTLKLKYIYICAEEWLNLANFNKCIISQLLFCGESTSYSFYIFQDTIYLVNCSHLAV
jgi:hypothetical protein